MNGNDCDIAIVDGGLAGGLIALAVMQQRPELNVRLIEAEATLGGNRRWSWFSSDLSPEGKSLMRHFQRNRWDSYSVHFPEFRRNLSTRYRSLASADFAAELAQALPAGSIRTGCPAAAIDAVGVTLETGERIDARAVIDCRRFVPSQHLTGGWQAFVGRHVRTDRPHGVPRPMIMDATVGQTGSFRFVHLLPLSEHELLMEDTYYQLRGSVDQEGAGRRLDRYAGRKHWDCELLDQWSGMLPVIAGGNFEAWQAEGRIEGVGRAGAGAGFLHPLTGYTLPFAVETALAIAREADLSGPELAAMLEALAREHWHSTRFYRRLGTLVFGAARASRRWLLFDRFFHLPTPVIERFYAGQSTRGDRLRILCGKPLVSPFRALRALATSRPPLRAAP